MSIKIIKLPEVVVKTALSIPTIYRLLAQGKFPERVRVSERSVGWIESDIDNFIVNKKDKHNMQNREEK